MGDYFFFFLYNQYLEKQTMRPYFKSDWLEIRFTALQMQDTTNLTSQHQPQLPWRILTLMDSKAGCGHLKTGCVCYLLIPHTIAFTSSETNCDRHRGITWGNFHILRDLECPVTCIAIFFAQMIELFTEDRPQPSPLYCPVYTSVHILCLVFKIPYKTQSSHSTYNSI